MESAEMISPPILLASSTAASLLPAAVGPATTINVCFLSSHYSLKTFFQFIFRK